MIIRKLNQSINVLLGGYADETLSARAYRRDWKIFQRLINRLFFWQENHCKQAFDNELARKQSLRFRVKNDKSK